MQMNNPPPNTANLINVVDMISNPRHKTKAFYINSWAISSSKQSQMKSKFGSAPWCRLKEKTVHLIAPGTLLREDFTQVTGPVHFVYCCFDAKDPFELRRLIGPSGHALIEDPRQWVLAKLLKMARTYNELGTQGWFKNQSQLYDLLDLFKGLESTGETGQWTFSSKKRSSLVLDFVDSVHRLMWPKRHSIIRLDDIAKELHLSRSSLSHRYKLATGESLLATQARWRLSEAKNLLDQELPIKVIAEHLGFCDIYHFSKVFKTQSGLSPREYRKQTQE